jgi:hypothetical protein
MVNNKFAIYNVDTNRKASAKQIYAVARHFAKLQSKTDAEAFKLTKVFGAIMMKFNAEHCETPITHGDIAKFFELEKVPAKFVEQITMQAPKASKKPKASAKTSTKSEKVIVAKTADTPKVKAAKTSDQSLTDFKARLDALASKQAETDKRLASIDAKMDLIMAFLETNPDA